MARPLVLCPSTFVDRKAAICMDKAITYGELDVMSAAIGAFLQSRGSRRVPALRS
jgi:hypothetical protein